MNVKKSTLVVFGVLAVLLGLALKLQYSGKTKSSLTNSLELVSRKVLGQEIQVLSPADGEILKLNGKYTIRWKATRISKIDIELEDWWRSGVGGPLTFLVAADVPAEAGYYEWDISKTSRLPDIIVVDENEKKESPVKSFPILGGKNYRLRIVNANDNSDIRLSYPGEPGSLSGSFTIEK